MAEDKQKGKKKRKSAAGLADAVAAAAAPPASEQLGSLAKKPKKSAADVVGIADAPEAAGQQAGQPAAAAKSKKRRKRKAGAGGEEAQLPAEEAARRRRQRELRQLALRLREQGKDYNPKKHRKHKPRRKVALIIVPIFWNKKVAEKTAVLEAAERVQALLRGAGVKCDTDTTTELTPGQKMRSWEEKGVMLRVELGGKEAEAGTAVVARCTTPGEVAQKQTVRVGQPLVQLVERHMQELGIPLQQPAPAAADAADGGAAPAPAPGAKDAEAAPRGKQAGAAQQAQQQQAAEQPAGKRGQQEQGPSGDALDGDFAGLPLLPQQATGKKGKKRQEAAAVAAAELAESVFGQGEDEQGQRKRKKQPKVVTF